MNKKCFLVLIQCIMFITSPSYAVKKNTSNYQHKRFFTILGLSLLSPCLGTVNLNRHLGVVKKRRAKPFRPTPRDECQNLGEKKKITYFIESIEGCPKPSDKANLIGENIDSYIANLSKKWQSTDFIAVNEKSSADFTIFLGDNSNSDKCPTSSYWSQGRTEMALGHIGVYGLFQRKQKRRTVLHEFGHVLGISHEHMHPDFPYTLDFDAIKSDKSNPGIHNYEPTNSKESYLSEYNIKSVMHYTLDRKETVEGKKFKLNFELSEGDHIAEFIAMPPCGLSSDEAYELYLDLKQQTNRTGENLTPELFCEHLFSNLGVNSTGRCEFPEDRYLVLSKYAIIGLSAAGGVLVLWCTKRLCCGECDRKIEKSADQDQGQDQDQDQDQDFGVEIEIV